MQYCRERRHVLGLAAATLAGLTVRPARACEFITDTLRVTHPSTRASVAGATSTLLNMRIDEVQLPDRLIEVSTSTPSIPAIESSIGLVTWDSITSAEAPG